MQKKHYMGCRQIDKTELPPQSAKRRACVFSIQCGTHTHFMAAGTAAEAEVLWSTCFLRRHALSVMLVETLDCSPLSYMRSTLCCYFVTHAVKLVTVMLLLGLELFISSLCRLCRCGWSVSPKLGCIAASLLAAASGHGTWLTHLFTPNSISFKRMLHCAIPSKS